MTSADATTTTTTTTATTASTDYTTTENRVLLRGRLSGPPETRELPSGDIMASFRLTMDRDGPGDRRRVDTVDCSTLRAGLRAKLERAHAGDMIEVEGALRRRFWRSPAGTAASRYSVEVEKLVNRSGRRGAAERARTRASA